MQDDCIFCKIVKGEIPSYKVWEDNNHLAILDIFPETEGKTVIITKAHKPSYLIENEEKTLTDLIKAMKTVGEILDSKLENIFRVTFIIEGLEVPHLHAKLVPVYKGVFSGHPQPKKEKDEKLQEIAKILISK